MTQLLLIILFAVIVTIYCSELNCGPGEIEDQCPDDCDMDYCPKNDKYRRLCNKPLNCGSPTCKCGFNYSRANNGTCIPTRECPPFPCFQPHEEYDPCPPYCPTDDCSQATPDGRCPEFGYILTILECRPACRCKKGYWRRHRVCVPYAQCPRKTRANLKRFSDIYTNFK